MTDVIRMSFTLILVTNIKTAFKKLLLIETIQDITAGMQKHIFVLINELI